jgi:quinoprotein glucose dehydrogenase
MVRMKKHMWLFRFGVSIGLGLGVLTSVAAQGQLEWPYTGGSKGSNKYSPIDQINRNNVKNLRIVWRHSAIPTQFTSKFPDLNPSHYLKSTPVMISGVLFAPDAVGLVEAFDPASGKTLWLQKPTEPGLRGLAGESTRGVAYWKNGSDQRVFSVRGEYLYALNAKTGRSYPEFGDRGRVNLHRNDPRAGTYAGTSGPVVAGDIVVVGETAAVREMLGKQKKRRRKT